MHEGIKMETTKPARSLEIWAAVNSRRPVPRIDKLLYAPILVQSVPIHVPVSPVIWVQNLV